MVLTYIFLYERIVQSPLLRHQHLQPARTEDDTNERRKRRLRKMQIVSHEVSKERIENEEAGEDGVGYMRRTGL